MLRADEREADVLDEVVASVGEGPWLLCPTAMRFAGLRRAGVFRRGAGPPVWVRDAYLVDDDVERLIERLDAVRADGNGMYADPWSHLWVAGEGTLHLWQLPDGPDLRVAGAVVRVGDEVLGRDEVVGAQLWVGEARVHRAVRLQLADGSFRAVAETSQWVAAIDPTHDALDLDLETAWQQRLVKVLRAVIRGGERDEG